MKFLFLIQISILLFFSFSCKKERNQCIDKIKPIAEFRINEMVGDTTFSADTIFRDNYVLFEALTNYQWVRWNVGNDPNVFTQPKFNLSFNNVLETLTVNFQGYKEPNSICFPTDSGKYDGQKLLTVVEQFQKPILTLSPLVGNYSGSFTDDPADTFTVRILYFDSTKYDISVTGTKNFYWLNNFPKNFENTSSPALAYPELRHGLSPEMGFKSLTFNYSTCVSGKGWLTHDSLIIIYGNSICGRRKFIGQRN